MFSISGPQILTYEYDQVGNRTKKIDGGVTTTYNYNGMNQLISLVENGVTTNFTYDANGNMTQKTKGIEWWKYYYDFENRLTKVEYFDGSQTIILGQYYYDGDGKRIKKVEASQTTIYIYLGWNIILEKESSTMTETKHVFGPNGHVADIKGSTRYYYHSDHLGSLRQETDDAGNAVWSSPAQYEPFGELRSGGSQNEDGYFYTGKLRDYRTGLYYYGNRYYDPIQGRFLTKDILAGSATNSQKWNPYIYVLNNPLKYTDPTGNYNSDEDRFSFAGQNGRIMTWNGGNVSGEDMFLTENGIVKIQTANTGTNSSLTINPTKTPVPGSGESLGENEGYNQYNDATQFSKNARYRIGKKVDSDGKVYYDFEKPEYRNLAISDAQELAIKRINEGALNPDEQADFVKGFLKGLLKGAEDANAGHSRTGGLPPPTMETSSVGTGIVVEGGICGICEIFSPTFLGPICIIFKHLIGIFTNWW